MRPPDSQAIEVILSLGEGDQDLGLQKGGRQFTGRWGHQKLDKSKFIMPCGVVFLM